MLSAVRSIIYLSLIHIYLTEIEELCDSVGLVHKGKVIFDRELDSIKGSIHKIQVAFDLSLIHI